MTISLPNCQDAWNELNGSNGYAMQRGEIQRLEVIGA